MLTCCMVAANLICGFIFAHTKNKFSWSNSFDNTFNVSTLQASGHLSYSRSLTNISSIQDNKPVQVTPPTPNFYIVKLVFTGEYFIFFPLKHRAWVLVRTASVRRFKRIPTIYVLRKNKIISVFSPDKLSFLQP